MSQLFDAMQTGTGLTENGAVTNTSSLNLNLDLFFLIGASRGKDLTSVFSRALGENPELATRILLWAGDVRGGAGERQLLKDLIKVVTKEHKVDANALFTQMVELSRWDNLFTFVGTDLEEAMLSFYASAISQNGLAAKWAPREKSSKRSIAVKLRKTLGLSSKEYRKLLVANSDTVEQKMCAGQWDSIEFGKLPSLASARYQKAFDRNAPFAYGKYKKALEKGDDKVNAGAVYPYDVVKSLQEGDTTVANAQWDALPDYLEGSEERILPVVDVSGSMHVPVSGSTTAIDVAVSLGLYLSERMGGIFKDKFITFSTSPSLQQVKGTLANRHRSMRRADWGGSTNLEKTFDLVLDAAVKNSIPESEMPSKILVVSDMEFDRCETWTGCNTNFETIRRKYERAGYNMPQLVFWNVNARSQSNLPVQKHDSGTALVSGFSPSIMKSLLKGQLNPMEVMLDAVMYERYTPHFLLSK